MINNYEWYALRQTVSMMQKNELWKSAFKEYNDEAKLNGEKELNMNCRPCFYTVLMWHKKRLNIL